MWFLRWIFWSILCGFYGGYFGQYYVVFMLDIMVNIMWVLWGIFWIKLCGFYGDYFGPYYVGFMVNILVHIMWVLWGIFWIILCGYYVGYYGEYYVVFMGNIILFLVELFWSVMVCSMSTLWWISCDDRCPSAVYDITNDINNTGCLFFALLQQVQIRYYLYFCFCVFVLKCVDWWIYIIYFVIFCF